MKYCLALLMLGSLLISKPVDALVQIADMPGTLTSGNEVEQTTASTQESVTQTTFLQKMAAKAGSAKNSISKLTDKVNNFKDKQLKKLEKHKEKLEKLKEKKAAIEAKKAKYEKKIKDAKGKIEDGINKAKEAKAKVEEYKAKAEGAIETAKEYKAKAEGAIETAKEYKDKASSTIDSAKSKVGIGDDSSSAENSASFGSSATGQDLVDTPSAIPSRTQINGAGGLADDSQLENTQAEETNQTTDKSVQKPERKIEKQDKKEDKVDAKITETEAKIEELENEIQNIDKFQNQIQEKAIVPTDETNTIKEDNKVNNKNIPTRKSFKTSIIMRSSETLAFADISMDGGTTPDDILIVPEEITLSDQCEGISYKTAAEGAMDTCLKKINGTRSSKVADENDEGNTENTASKESIDDATQMMQNGLAEYASAGFFEALNIYNESFNFKNDQVDPVVNRSIGSVDEAWVNVKEMQKIVGTRFNNLRKLWARSLGTQVFEVYQKYGIKSASSQQQ